MDMHKHNRNYLLFATLLAYSFLMAACTKTQEPMKNQIEPKTEHENVKTFPSGLKYQILEAAPEDAKKPTKGQLVTVHYTGWLEDKNAPDNKGKKFDSSVDRDEKFSFTVGVGQVIKGWDEGVMDMKIGEKRRLIIPSELGYGSRGAGALIPGGATLIFDVELFKAE